MDIHSDGTSTWGILPENHERMTKYPGLGGFAWSSCKPLERCPDLKWSWGARALYGVVLVNLPAMHNTLRFGLLDLRKLQLTDCARSAGCQMCGSLSRVVSASVRVG